MNGLAKIVHKKRVYNKKHERNKARKTNKETKKKVFIQYNQNPERIYSYKDVSMH